MRWIRIAAVATVLALASSGCGDDGPSGNTGSIQVAVTPAALSVPRGGTGSVNASLTRGGGFTGAVTLAISGLPAGVTTTVTPAQLTGTTADATVAVTVASTVALGVHPATITATAAGVGQATATYQLTVTEAQNFGLAVAPPALALVAGASGGATVSINRTNFTGAVALALLNPPEGITGVFNPALSTTDVSTLVVSVAAAVAPGSYPVTIQGVASGPGARTTTITVNVPVPPAGGNVEYQFCSGEEVPAFVAYQDGAGPWQAVTGSSSGAVTRFTFNLAQGYGGIMFVYQTAAAAEARLQRTRAARAIPSRHRLDSGGGPARAAYQTILGDTYYTEVLFATAVEFAQDAVGGCEPAQPTKTVSGTVAGVPAGAYGIVSLGGDTRIFNGAEPANPVIFTDVPAGLVDFVGTRTTPGNPPSKAIVLRNLNIPDGGALPSVINFDGPTSFVPASATATMTGGAGDNLEVFVDLVTANSHLGMWFDLSPSPVATRSWAGLPPAAMLSGDFHGIFVFASAQGSPGDLRLAVKYVGPVAPQVLAFGPPLAAPTISQVVAGAYPRYRFQGALASEYNKGVFIEVVSEDESGNIFTILATGAYLAARGNPLAYDFTMPDVVALAGFPVEARLTAGTNLVVTSGFGFTGTGIFEQEPRLGGESKHAVKNATITVP